MLLILLLLSGNPFNNTLPPQNAPAAIPAGYYDAANGKSGAALSDALHNIIKGHTKYPYTSTATDVWDILKVTDEDTANSNNVILIYSGRSQDKDLNSSHGSNADYWNREHVWSKSHGFPNESDTAYTDIHHLRPCDASINSSRNNKDFDNGGTPHVEATGCFADSDSWEPRDAVKGDVARMMFYMDVRYENDGDYDLELQEDIPSSGPRFAKLSVLLQWHAQDPVDNWERQRNDKIYSYQNNRNPFIDHPEYVDMIWGSGVKDEPDNHVTSFNGSVNGQHITLNWSDAIGTVVPDYYLIKLSDVSLAAITQPVDGVAYVNDTDGSDGSAIVSVISGTESYLFKHLSAQTTYHFKIFPYTNSGSAVNYKTDGVVPALTLTTGTSPVSDLFISEYIEGSSGTNKYLEIFNGTGIPVSLNDYDIQIYFNGNGSAGTTIALSGTIAHNDAFVLAHASATNWPGTPDQTHSGLNFNGNDVVVLRKNGNDLDKIGVVGNSSMLYNDKTMQRASSVTAPQAVFNAAEWDDLAEDYNALGSFTSDATLPVSLSQFSITRQNDGVVLSWSTASETDNSGFIVEKRVENAQFTPFASWQDAPELKGAGNSNQTNSYKITDMETELGMSYSYRLWDESFSGEKTLLAQMHIMAGEEENEQFYAHTYKLGTNYPNPFNPTTHIPFTLKEAQQVKLVVYNINGAIIKTIYSGLLSAGKHTLRWNGTNNAQQQVGSGVYIYQLVSEQFNASKRMLLLR